MINLTEVFAHFDVECPKPRKFKVFSNTRSLTYTYDITSYGDTKIPEAGVHYIVGVNKNPRRTVHSERISLLIVSEEEIKKLGLEAATLTASERSLSVLPELFATKAEAELAYAESGILRHKEDLEHAQRRLDGDKKRVAQRVKVVRILERRITAGKKR